VTDLATVHRDPTTLQRQSHVRRRHGKAATVLGQRRRVADDAVDEASHSGAGRIEGRGANAQNAAAAGEAPKVVVAKVVARGSGSLCIMGGGRGVES